MEKEERRHEAAFPDRPYTDLEINIIWEDGENATPQENAGRQMKGGRQNGNRHERL